MNGPPPAPTIVDRQVDADVVIVGAGVAGLYAAVELPDGLDVVVVDKGAPGGDSGSSPWAQGGMAAAIAPDDTPAQHVEDTVLAGDGLCDVRAVEVLAQEAPRHVARLLDLGAHLDRLPGHLGSVELRHLSLAREGGQRVGRSVRRADATGAEMVRVLREAAAPRVRRLVAVARALAVADDGRVVGLHVVVDGAPVLVRARAVVLATGGCGGLYAATTNPSHATADGLAMAAAAGAAVRDVEFVQFHPTGLAVGGTWRFLLTEALRGAGATLHDAGGHRFVLDHHPDGELAPRHVVASAILSLDDGRAWLDATHLGPAVLEREFPTVLAGARRHGYDLASERVPVTPAAHYQVGGVRTDLWGRTSVPGLYACGEVASTGVHGANRLASNSLTEAMVFGARTALAAAGELPADRPLPSEWPVWSPQPRGEAGDLRKRLREAMLLGAGPVRDAAGLAALAAQLERWTDEHGDPAPDHDEVEIHHALRAAALLVRAARLRTESRGGHVRADHPGTDPAWADIHLEQVGAPGA